MNESPAAKKERLRRALDQRYTDLWPGGKVGGQALRPPLFPGAGQAAERLRRQPEYKSCQTALVMPDPALLQVRINLLNDGKTLVAATPGLKQGLVRISPDTLPMAKRSLELRGHHLAAAGRPVRPPLDKPPAMGLFVAAALAAEPGGLILGDGRGLADFLAALLERAGFFQRSVKLAVLLADEQLVDELPFEPWDLAANLLITPSRVIRNETTLPKAGLGHLPGHLANLPLAKAILGG